jgi:hypothetical protein
MPKKYTERVHKGEGYQIRILNIPDDLSEEEKKKLQEKKGEMIKLIGGERAKQKQPEIT